MSKLNEVECFSYIMLWQIGSISSCWRRRCRFDKCWKGDCFCYSRSCILLKWWEFCYDSRRSYWCYYLRSNASVTVWRFGKLDDSCNINFSTISLIRLFILAIWCYICDWLLYFHKNISCHTFFLWKVFVIFKNIF